MFDTVFGLPVHPLIVHATVVVGPLAALLRFLAVCSPRFRAWAGLLPAGLSLAALVLTPLSTASGESLERTVGDSALVERHAELGDQLLPLTAALFVLSSLYWWLDRRRRLTLPVIVAPAPAPVRPTPGGGTATLSAPTPEATASAHATRWRTATSVVGVLAVLAAVATGVQVARIGHSGAKAAWSDASSQVR